MKKVFPIPSRLEFNDDDTPSCQVPLFQDTTAKLLALSRPLAEKVPEADALWTSLQNDHIYNDKAQVFQWRKSVIRTAFLESISAMVHCFYPFPFIYTCI